MAYTEERVIVPEQYHYPAGYTITRRIVSYAVQLLELVLALRLVFKAFGANASAGFIRFVYGLTEPFVQPFAGIFPAFRGDTVIIEWSTVMAMVIYALAAMLLLELLRIVLRPVPRTHT